MRYGGGHDSPIEHISPHAQLLALMKTELERLARSLDARAVHFVLRKMGGISYRAGVDKRFGEWRPNLESILQTSSSLDVSHGLSANSKPGHFSVERQPPSSATFRIPIEYANTEIGELGVDLLMRSDRDPAVRTTCQNAARELAFLAKRHEVHTWAARKFAMNMFFVGQSPALREVETFVEQASQSPLPVLIGGEFGTEKPLTAAAIHALSRDARGGFVEIHCAAQQIEDGAARIAESIEAARGGTVFFNGIDELPPRVLQKLPELLGSRIGQSLTGQSLTKTSGDRPARLIASTTANLHEMVQDGRFPKALLAELDFLSVEVPALRERREDIPAILAYVLEKNGFLAQEKCSDELVATCMAHAWPENLFELERVVVRLAAMTGRSPISSAHIEKHTPWIRIASGVPSTASNGFRNHPAGMVTVGNPVRPAPSRVSVEQWVMRVMTKDLSGLRTLHPNLQKALVYLSENSSESISLGQLAKNACISPSHLAYLFKSALGISFKPFLGRIRIEKAKQLLVDDAPVRITEIALDVGFMDLSHFEKLFKRIVGMNARDYRRRRLSAQEAQEATN